MAEHRASPPADRAAAPGRLAGTRAVPASASAPGDALLALVASANEEDLAALLEHPAFDKDHAVLVPALLDRKDLAESIMERIAKRTSWIASAVLRRNLAMHPHAPRRVVVRLLREFHLLDLVQFSLQPATPPDLRRLAEDLLVARIGQLPLGQKKMLARRGSARVAGSLLLDSSVSVVAAALDNHFVTEAQVLKALSRRTLEAHAVSAIAHHARWSQHAAVRVALATHPHAPIDRVLAILPELPRRDLEDLAAVAHLSASLRQYFRRELARRLRLAPAPAEREALKDRTERDV